MVCKISRLFCRIIAVGISTSVDPSQLESVATGADFVVLVSDFNELENYFDEVFVRLCDDGSSGSGTSDCCKLLNTVFHRECSVLARV